MHNNYISSKGGGSSLTSCGFTLAEVLITLAIIGIVAAMTIPTLVANYQNKAWNTSAQVFERKLEEALKTMNTQQVLAGYSNTSDFVSALGNYFKITKVCKSDDILSCFEDTITWKIIDVSSGSSSEQIDIASITSASDLGQDDWNTEAIGVQFANGTTGVIAYNPNCKEQPFTNTFSGTNCISLIYDTNGLKNPNTHPNDIRSINTLLKNCSFKISGTCFTAPITGDEPLSYEECSQHPEWGISCIGHYDDYFGGAVKKCGGLDKLPTEEQLAELASYLYNTNISVGQNIGHLTLDTDKVAQLGFSQDTNGQFSFFSNNVGTGYSVKRYYSMDGTFYGYGYRNVANQQTICVGN